MHMGPDSTLWNVAVEKMALLTATHLIGWYCRRTCFCITQATDWLFGNFTGVDRINPGMRACLDDIGGRIFVGSAQKVWEDASCIERPSTLDTTFTYVYMYFFAYFLRTHFHFEVNLPALWSGYNSNNMTACVIILVGYISDAGVNHGCSSATIPNPGIYEPCHHWWIL